MPPRDSSGPSIVPVARVSACETPPQAVRRVGSAGCSYTAGIYYGGPQLIGPVVYIKTYIFNHFYLQNLVLLTMPPRTQQLPGTYRYHTERDPTSTHSVRLEHACQATGDAGYSK